MKILIKIRLRQKEKHVVYWEKMLVILDVSIFMFVGAVYRKIVILRHTNHDVYQIYVTMNKAVRYRNSSFSLIPPTTTDQGHLHKPTLTIYLKNSNKSKNLYRCILLN